jgi:tryptophan synthase alpha chain
LTAVFEAMANRIDECFKRLRAENCKGFIPYICAGDPTFTQTVKLCAALEEAGADILELGLPFSDPLADGIVNQLAAQRALAGGATVQKVLDCVAEIRKASQIPIVLYTYMNPIFQFGWKNFHGAAQTAGVDGLLILDLPPEEDIEPGLSDLYHVRLIAPTSPPERMRRIAEKARGFIYYVSREGVTGAREGIASSLADRVSEIKKLSTLPVAVGFGISTPAQAREAAKAADAVVVGSAIVTKIAEHGDAPDLVKKTLATAKPLIEAVKAGV